MTQTNNPLFDSFTEEQKQRYLRWTTFSDCKSKVLSELYRKTPKSGYSCNMIIIDDITDDNMYLSAETIETAMKNWKDKTAQFRSQYLFKLPENAISRSVLFTEAELTDVKT